jgi:hypothetical protein
MRHLRGIRFALLTEDSVLSEGRVKQREEYQVMDH